MEHINILLQNQCLNDARRLFIDAAFTLNIVDSFQVPILLTCRITWTSLPA